MSLPLWTLAAVKEVDMIAVLSFMYLQNQIKCQQKEINFYIY